MRLQSFLSKTGLSSRRAGVDIIRKGQIRVNGKKIFEPSFKVDPERDSVSYNGKRIIAKERIYILLHKPRCVTTTKKDRFAKKTVMDLLPQNLRHLNPVGRLDKDTSGLLLLTNDGVLHNKLTHPRFDIDKTYIATLDKRLNERDRQKLEKGIELSGKRTAACRISLEAKNGLEITLHEGRKRQIKRMFAGLGYKVLWLKRTREGPLSLNDLPAGKWRTLTQGELSRLI